MLTRSDELQVNSSVARATEDHYGFGQEQANMRLFVGVTDWGWWSLHASKLAVEEVNFWRPSSTANFQALAPGEIFLFKLHAPRNAIAGGGFFTKFLSLPVSLAWDAFGEGNGARSLAEVRQRIGFYRRAPIEATEDPNIGCILLEEPFFFAEPDWIPIPPDFSLNVVSGKGYDTFEQAGQLLWQQVGERLQAIRIGARDAGPALVAATDAARHGSPLIVLPRLGQGSFRVLVTDAYARRCAVSGERTLPVLQAAHIKPYAAGGEHQLSNGILLRSDLHTLFDKGYLGIDPKAMRILVSSRIREQFENGRDYYSLEGKTLRLPGDPAAVPAYENLAYHAEKIFH
jgi:putative restriction endonuclease